MFMFFVVNQVILFYVSFLTKSLHERFDKAAIEESTMFNHLISWDAMHFIKIQKLNYFYEHSMAFLFLHIKIASNIKMGIVLNNIYFCISYYLMYKIALIHYKGNHIMSRRVVMYFLLNTSSIIYSSFYTESLFTMIFLLGYYNIIKNNQIYGTILLSLSTLCRSNGILFICLTNNLVYAILIIIPFSIYQVFCILKYWSNNCLFRIIIPYSFIQKTYWNQGLLKFITFKQLPNIIIGLPTILLSIKVIYKYSNMKEYYNRKLNLLLLIKLLLVIFTMHWNMAGRFLSFHPFVYFYLAESNNKHLCFFLLTLRLLYIIMFSSYYPPA